MGEKQFNQIIKEGFSSLSPGQKRVAEYIKGHMDEGALHTAYQIGKKAGVSETTVIRLAYALGFSGFSDLQEKVRRDWLENKQASQTEVSAAIDTTEESQLFETVIQREKSILEQLLNQGSSEDLWVAVDKIVQADRIFIGGFGSSFAAAYWFYYSLRQLRENVSISTPTGFMPEDVSEFTEKSLVIVFSFPRYRNDSLKLVNSAKQQKAGVLAITNRQLSPVGQIAELTLTTEEQIESSHNSISSAITLLEVLIAGIHHKDEERISSRQQKLERIYANHGLFIE
ncbi:MurR/RpiR family transcriptional regulator [Mesobacillus maritimus]|uniref:MurR/RpiR family transcriptional regulator n=1 Tax=Mesobacillus maritimus TaxID=1643336 RepID=UPI00384C11E0